MTNLGLAILIGVMVLLLIFFTWTVFRARITKTEFFISNLFVMFLGMAGGGMLQTHDVSWLWWVLAAILVFLLIVFMTLRKIKSILTLNAKKGANRNA